MTVKKVALKRLPPRSTPRPKTYEYLIEVFRHGSATAEVYMADFIHDQSKDGWRLFHVDSDFKGLGGILVIMERRA